MSGFVALFNRDGKPVAPGELAALTDQLAPLAPDARRWWHGDAIGLGHALFATTDDASRTPQPACLQARWWLSGDFRIDARAELIAKLGADARLRAATDAELVLHAYRRWGARCVDHLLGDYAFVVWDSHTQRLFAARDPLGVKQLYYACIGNTLLVSNAVSCLRAHRSVSSRLDDEAVTRFLLGEIDAGPARTMFADIARVPPGHWLQCRRGAPPVVRQYFALPETVAPLRYRCAQDYLAHFHELLESAVADRLRTARVGISMSGGIDSTMVAAVAARLQRDRGGASIEAFTHVFDTLIPHDERSYAAAAARQIGIPLRCYPADAFFRSWRHLAAGRAAEPGSQYAAAHARTCCPDLPERMRVALTGFDGDTLLASSLAAHWRSRLARGELLALMREVGWHALERSWPRLGIRSALRRWRQAARAPDDVTRPPWLPDRGSEFALQRGQPGNGPVEARGLVRAYLESPVLRATLQDLDPYASGIAIEHRHPLLDLRLVRFCLAIPVHPWCHDKYLFRTAMREALPAAVLQRRKAPLLDDPRARGFASPGFLPGGARAPAAALARYVDVPEYLRAFEAITTEAQSRTRFAWQLSCALALDVWLERVACNERLTEVMP